MTHIRHISSDGDLFVATCSCGRFVSEGFDTRKEARDAHVDHVLSERVNSR